MYTPMTHLLRGIVVMTGLGLLDLALGGSTSDSPMAIFPWVAAASIGSKLLGGGSKASAERRAAEAEALIEQEKLRQSGERSYFDTIQNREQIRNQASQGAWGQLLRADRVANPVQAPGFSPYSRQAPQRSAHMQSIARDPGVIERLRNRYSFEYDPLSANSNDLSRNFVDMPTRTPDFSRLNKALKPGLLERIAGYGSIALGIPGALKRGQS